MKTTFKKYVVLSFLLLSFLSACTASSSVQAEEAEATLVWSGEYMSDGCGFHLVINNTTYKPEDEDAIEDAYKSEMPTQVMVTFERLNEPIDRRCGLSPESKAMPGIKIISVVPIL